MQHSATAMERAVLVLCLGAMLMSSCNCRTIRKPLAANQADAPVVVTFSNLKPTLASIWVPSISTSAQLLQVPVSGLPGTPLDTNDMSRLTYTVKYSRKAAYVLKGSLNISPHPMFSSIGQPAPDTPLEQPLITLSQSNQQQSIPANKIKCSSLMVTDLSSVTCSFQATIFSETLPPAGSAQAVITIPGTGTNVQTPVMQYDFSTALPPNARFSSVGQSTEYLLNSMDSMPSTAVVTNYFEKGDNLVLPSGIAGTQPAANSILRESQTFTYTAVFGDMPRAMCGKRLQIMSTATIQSTSDGIQQPETFTSKVDLALLGCDSPAFQDNDDKPGCNKDGSTPTRPTAPTGATSTPVSTTPFTPRTPAAAAPAAVDMAGRTAPPGEASPQQQQQPGSALILPQDLSEAHSAAAAVVPELSENPFIQAARRRSLLQDGRIMPQGVFMAATGSKLCGRNVCSADEDCIDNVLCCPSGASRCGSTCCGAGNVCMLDSMCMAAGSQACGSTACSPGQQCLSGKCCDSSQPACGSSCCNSAAGEVCVLGQCVAQGSSACGSTVCGPNQACVAPGVCCGAGETACGASCCSGQCLNGQCVAPGSSLCGGVICAPGTTCAGGAICCPLGASFCGGQCCGSGNSCVQNRCVAYGATPCGANVCSPDQSCQNGVCCQRGETGCGTGCCNTAAGMQCIRGQCLPWGTQPCGATTCPIGTRCGDPMRSLCCPVGTRSCNGNCCGRDQVCSWRLQQCVAANSEAAKQAADEGQLAGPDGYQDYSPGSNHGGGYAMPYSGSYDSYGATAYGKRKGYF